MQNISGLVIVLLWIFWGVWSYDIAKQKGYNANLAALAGVLFGIFSVIIYALLPPQKNKKKEGEEIKIITTTPRKRINNK